MFSYAVEVRAAWHERFTTGNYCLSAAIAVLLRENGGTIILGGSILPHVLSRGSLSSHDLREDTRAERSFGTLEPGFALHNTHPTWLPDSAHVLSLKRACSDSVACEKGQELVGIADARERVAFDFHPWNV